MFFSVLVRDLLAGGVIKNLSPVTMVSNENLANSLNPDEIDDLFEDEVISQFGLSLSAGRIGRDGGFVPITTAVAVGERVQIMLNTIDTPNFK